MSLHAPTVLIIGATSGIGEALALRFAKDAAVAPKKVIITGRRQDRLDAIAAQSPLIEGVAFDASRLADIEQFVEDMVARGVDYVVINAGIQRGMDYEVPEQVDLAAFEDELTVNYRSPVVTLTAFLKHFKPSETPATLCVVTSGLSLVPLPRCPGYCASKAALRSFTLGLRRQLEYQAAERKDGKLPVRIVDIIPPAVQTELHDAKHQPDFGDKGAAMGEPLNEYTDDLYGRLVKQEEDEIAYGGAAQMLEAVGKTQRAIMMKMPVKLF